MKKYQNNSKQQKYLKQKSKSNQIVKKLTIQLLQTYTKCNPNFHSKYNKVPKRLLTEPSQGIYNQGYDNIMYDYIFYMHDMIRNEKRNIDYQVQELLGKGTFGQVMGCRNNINEKFAIKVIKNRPAYQNQAIFEVKILRQINKYDQSLVQQGKQSRIIRMFDVFVWRKHLCLVFQVLQNTLYDFGTLQYYEVKQSQFQGLDLDWIREWAQQILQGLIRTHQIGIIHCDLKPQNIMFVKDKDNSHSKLKIIDFGSSCFQKETVYSYIQSRFYRAPEIILAIPYNNKIDIWSFGCILVELYLGLPLFPGNSVYDQLKKIIAIIGVPSDELIKKSINKDRFFTIQNNKFRLKTEQEYENQQNLKLPPSKNYYKLKSLDELKNSKILQVKSEIQDHLNFIDFIKLLLQFDPEKRISAKQAISHKFLRESHKKTQNNLLHFNYEEIKQFHLYTEEQHIPNE